jgi:F0F1-type ATP synthase beta subunit
MLHRYRDLQNIIAILGVGGFSEGENLTVSSARKIGLRERSSFRVRPTKSSVALTMTTGDLWAGGAAR